MEAFAVVEIFTQVITYFMIAAGVPTCLSMLRTKDTYGVPYPFFLVGLVNSVMSIAYGSLVENSTFIQINTISALFGVFYVLSYIYASRNKSQPATQLLACGGIVFCIYVYMSRFVAAANVLNTLGSILLVVTTVLLLTPVLQIKEVVADQTAAGVSLFMLACSSLCSSAWALYGYLLKDFFIYGPNCVGIFISACTWVAVFMYGTAKPKGHTD